LNVIKHHETFPDVSKGGRPLRAAGGEDHNNRRRSDEHKHDQPWAKLEVAVVRKLRSVVVAVAMALGLVVAPAAPASAIVGGSEATSVPGYLGSLQVKPWPDIYSHQCGVSLITRKLPGRGQWALTNSHCVDNFPTAVALAPTALPQAAKARQAFAEWMATTVTLPPFERTDPKNYRVRIGSVDRLSGGQVRDIAEIRRHPAWGWGIPDAQGRVGDIALLQLSGPEVHAKPALLWQTNATKPITLTGWGFTAPSRPEPLPLIAREVTDFKATAPATCASAGIGTDEQCIAAHPGGIGPCGGDSASGLRQSNRVVGTVSRGTPEAEQICGIGAWVATAPATELEWIARTVLNIPDGQQVTTRDLLELVG
jgi:trypsin